MFKTGISRLPAAHNLSRSRRAREVSCQLLKNTSIGDEKSVKLFEFVTRDLQLSSGIYRTTYPNRFPDVNAAANRIIRETFSDAPIEVHDWAASDCLASAEWAESLWEISPSARLVASDIFLNLIEATRSDGTEAYILEPDGAPLQYIRRPFVLSLQKRIPPYYPVNRFLAARARRASAGVQEVLRRCQWPESDDLAALNLPPWTLQRISLVHPTARLLRTQNPQFEIRTHSVFTPLPHPAHVIRTMNIFNPAYFEEPSLKQGIRTVFDSLVDGGIWVVGRTTEETQPPRNRASIFRKGAGFSLLSQIHDGSEIQDLVLQDFISTAIRS